MEHIIKCNWNNGMSFESEVNGHNIIIDAEKDFGGNNLGPRPKPLLLLALSGCTGMDVVSLLKKMKVQYDEFYIDVKGILSEEHPKYYKEIQLIYNISGQKIDKNKVDKAIRLSQEKYCGVNFMLGKSSSISYKVYIT